MHYVCALRHKTAASALALLVFLTLVSAALLNPNQHVFSMGSTAPTSSESSDSNASSNARDAFGRLPLSFEANEGQADRKVLFLTRGHDVSLFLTAGGAVFSFNGTSSPLRMRLDGASASGCVSGLDQLPGKVNYLVGNKSEQWRTNISTYGRVRYEQIYDGVDLVYYGNQRQLEYDFIVAPRASFKQIRLAFEGDGKLKLNRRGDLVWQSGPRNLTLLRPRAYQEIGGNRRTIEARYLLTSNGQVGFHIGKYDRSQQLIIDPVLAYSTYLGGSDLDQAQSIAVDSSGNAYITGQTSSTNFPTTPAAPATGTNVFVTKLNAAGTALVYSTVIGGASIDSGASIACDNSGNAYVVGQTSSADFPVLNALHPTLAGASDAFVLELNASGSAPVFSTFLGGRSGDGAAAIALDNAGNAYVTGSTSSTDFPTTNPLQALRGGNSIFKTTDAAGSWGASDSGLLASTVADLKFDPSNSSVIYAATEAGIFKTINSGASWTALSGQPPIAPARLAIDPSNPNIIYTAGSGGIFKSTDGGNTFNAINNGVNPLFARTIVIDPVTPATLYAVGISNLLFKSIDGGANWTQSTINTPSLFVSVVNALLIDPNTPTTLYAATSRGVVKSTNAAASWDLSSPTFPITSVNTVALDKTNNLLYAGTNFGILKSSNGGANWTSIDGNFFAFVTTQVIPDPTNSSIIYQVSGGALFKTVDAGSTWTLSNSGIPSSSINTLLLNPTQPATLYAGGSSGSDVFVTKFNSNGTSQLYSTFLGGNSGDSGNGIAVDAAGNAYVVGTTSSVNFPTANPIQPARDANSSDAFVAKLNPSGSALVYSTFLGGNSTEFGRGIAVDGSGNAYVTGSTLSTNFPLANAFQTATQTFDNQAFVTKLNPAGSSLVFSTYLGGSGNDDGFDIAVDSTGSAYVTGSTTSIDFPTTGAFQPARNGPADAFVTKFAPNGQSLVYSTYLGGGQTEGAVSLALDSSNNVYVVGTTDSTNFPTLNPLQAANGGARDAFVAKLTAAPDLALTISDSPDPVFFNTNLTYTINIANNGDAPATGVAVSDTVPEGATLVSVNTTTGTCSGTISITCAIGTLNAGATATITLVISPPPIKSFSNTAFVTLNEPDTFTPNNTATVQTAVAFADLSIKKNVAQTLVAPGGKLTYSLLVKNLGGIAAPATVIDNLPAGTSLISCTTTGSGVCGGSGNNVTVQIPSLAPNQSQAVLLTVGVSASAVVGTVISNTAAISSPVPDTDVNSNSSTAVVTVATVPFVPKSNGLIAFAADRAFTPVAEPTGIYKVTPAGTGETLFPNVPLNAWRPAWSPDGTKLAFQRFVSPASEIGIVNADGTGLIKIVDNAAGFRKPMSWSPTGKQIAFIGTLNQADFNSIETINIVNVDGSGSYKLPGSPGFLESVDWSPDGTKFLYTSGGVVSVINADGTGITQLTTVQMTDDGPTTDAEPHWSPDGTRIIFTRLTNNSNAIYMMNADGTNTARLFNFGGRQADWSADGLSAVFQQANEICTAKLDGTDFKCVTNNIYYEFDPHWQELPNASPTPTPSPGPTFSISGKITAGDGSPMAVQIQVSGPTSAVSASNSLGDYSFANLPAGQYTVTPLSVSHTFAPVSRTVTITNTNITAQDFVGTFVPANLTGHVKDNNGNPLSGIKVTSTGGIPEGSTLTDVNGFYSFANVQRGRTYVIEPDPFTAYTFVPPSQTLNDLISNQVVDFVGTKQPSNVIAGRVIETVTGQGVAGIQVTLKQDNVLAGTVLTDSNGNFTFGERKSNLSYTVSLALHATFDFEPKSFSFDTSAQFQIPSLTSDQNLIFNGARRNVIQFSTGSYSVGEAAGFREIVVTRTGDVASPAFVTYATGDSAGLVACTVVNGKASERCDYETVVGTLRFAAGETTKSIFVPIIDDAHVEGNETFNVTLSGAVGATLTFTTAVVTITDNDASPSAQNPIDGVQSFVTQQYIDFLGRLPDSIGLANWMATLNGCPNGGFGENDNPDCDRVHVSAGFFLSDEFRGRGYWAYRFYEVGFNRRPLYAEFVPDMAQVGGAQSPESELLSKAAYTTAFAQRPEFTNRYDGMNNSAYVNALEQNAEIILTNKAALIAALDANQKSRADVLREIVESKDVEDRFFIRAFVAMQYFGYLRRDPDTIGYNNWVTTLQQDPSNFRHMIFGFLFSSEYRGRFGAP